jgi:hypothetical protein
MLREQFGVLGPERYAGADRLLDERAGPPDGVGEIKRELFRNRGVPRLDVDHGANRHRGHGARLNIEPVLDVKRRPGRLLLVLGDARRVLGGIALRGLIGLVRPQPERVDRGEADRAPDGGVGAEARPEHVPLAVEADPLADRVVEHEHRRGAGRALPGRSLNVAFEVHSRPRGASPAAPRRLRAPFGEELGQVRLRHRDHGQAVGPAALAVLLHDPPDLVDFDDRKLRQAAPSRSGPRR